MISVFIIGQSSKSSPILFAYPYFFAFLLPFASSLARRFGGWIRWGFFNVWNAWRIRRCNQSSKRFSRESVYTTPSFYWPNLLLLRLKHVTAWVDRGGKEGWDCWFGWLSFICCHCCLELALLFCFNCLIFFFFFFPLHVTQYWLYQLNKGRCSRDKFAALDLYSAWFQDKKRKKVEEGQNGRLLSSGDGSENTLKGRFSSLWYCKSASMALDTKKSEQTHGSYRILITKFTPAS